MRRRWRRRPRSCAPAARPRPRKSASSAASSSAAPSATSRGGSTTSCAAAPAVRATLADRKSTRLNSSHSQISYAVFCLKKKKKRDQHVRSEYHQGRATRYIPVVATSGHPHQSDPRPKSPCGLLRPHAARTVVLVILLPT